MKLNIACHADLLYLLSQKYLTDLIYSDNTEVLTIV